ncbi:XkdX family protein [Oscillospiraceae bacterium CM]|nr:XkdX family protein [Oscillospiraceae bacterium CM]
MFERLKRLFDAGTLTIDGLKNAVVKDWVTTEQYEEITGQTYAV